MEIMEEVESEREYDGYYYSLGEALSIVVLGSLCGLKNVSQIHQWAESERTREWLKEKFAIERIPCYYWLLSVLKMVKPESLNQCLSQWVRQMLPEEREGLTLAVDGKTVRSTEGKKGYQRPLHIISAQLSELGVTLASKSVDGKSNEIPAVQELLQQMDIAGCLVVADALNCQRETAKVIVSGKGDYLLSVKENQPSLMQDIRDYVQDEALRGGMSAQSIREKSRERIEKMTAFVTQDITAKGPMGSSCLYRSDSYGISNKGGQELAMALLYFQPTAFCAEPASPCPDGMGRGIHALAAGCSL